MSDSQSTGGIPGWVWGMLVGLFIFGAGYFIGTSGGDSSVEAGGGGFATTLAPSPETSAAAQADPTTTVEQNTTTSAAVLPPPTQYSDLPPILVTELPIEAIDTLDLIASGGPYPFDRDGLTFQNREELLPDHPRGHYQEYTVITPGASTRGARRIVAGADGELYYTSDHYSSFSEIVIED